MTYTLDQIQPETISLEDWMESQNYPEVVKNLVNEYGIKAVETYLDYFGIDPDNLDPCDFEERFQGEWESKVEFTQHYFESTGDLDNWERAGMRYYWIDWEWIAHELFISDFEKINNIVFNCR